MTNSSDEAQEQGGGDRGIDDEQLPEDLRPGDDNPLAGGLDDAETAGDLAPGELLEEGKPAEQGGDDQNHDPGDDDQPEDQPDDQPEDQGDDQDR
jgi:hypothetical protein